MTSETVREHVSTALDHVVTDDVPLDEAEQIFADAQRRIDDLRTVRGDGA